MRQAKNWWFPTRLDTFIWKRTHDMYKWAPLTGTLNHWLKPRIMSRRSPMNRIDHPYFTRWKTSWGDQPHLLTDYPLKLLLLDDHHYHQTRWSTTLINWSVTHCSQGDSTMVFLCFFTRWNVSAPFVRQAQTGPTQSQPEHPMNQLFQRC